MKNIKLIAFIIFLFLASLTSAKSGKVRLTLDDYNAKMKTEHKESKGTKYSPKKIIGYSRSENLYLKKLVFYEKPNLSSPVQFIQTVDKLYMSKAISPNCKISLSTRSGHDFSFIEVFDYKNTMCLVKYSHNCDNDYGWIDCDNFIKYYDHLKGNITSIYYKVIKLVQFYENPNGEIIDKSQLEKEMNRKITSYIGAEILRTKKIGSSTWVQIKLGVDLCDNQKEGTTPKIVWVKGWIEGQPTIDYASKGC